MQNFKKFYYNKDNRIWYFDLLSDRAVLLAFWGILNQGSRPNKTENSWHYVKRVISCILIEVGEERFMSYSVYSCHAVFVYSKKLQITKLIACVG